MHSMLNRYNDIAIEMVFQHSINNYNNFLETVSNSNHVMITKRCMVGHPVILYARG